MDKPVRDPLILGAGLTFKGKYPNVYWGVWLAAQFIEALVDACILWVPFLIIIIKKIKTQDKIGM